MKNIVKKITDTFEDMVSYESAEDREIKDIVERIERRNDEFIQSHPLPPSPFKLKLVKES